MAGDIDVKDEDYDHFLPAQTALFGLDSGPHGIEPQRCAGPFRMVNANSISLAPGESTSWVLILA